MVSVRMNLLKPIGVPHSRLFSPLIPPPMVTVPSPVAQSTHSSTKPGDALQELADVTVQFHIRYPDLIPASARGRHTYNVR